MEMDTTVESDGSIIYLTPRLGIECVLKCTDRLRSIFRIGSHKNRKNYAVNNVIWPCVPGVLVHKMLG